MDSRLRSLAVAAVVLAGTAVCVGLGFWQISRLHEKQALNAALRESLAAVPRALGPGLVPADSVVARPVEVRGRYDETRQVLLVDRTHDGTPGVEVVTPLVPAGATWAVLVDRGWLPSPDASSARPQDCAEPGERVVRGLPQPLPRGAPRTGDTRSAELRTLEVDSVRVWTTVRLDADSLATRFPYALAPYVVRALPGPGVPTRPLRLPPHPYDEFMHVSYAVQWFLFGAILLGGSLIVAWRRRRGRAR